MVPADMLLMEKAGLLPAMVVMRHRDGATHFVVVWRVHGRLVQVMDPAAGRIWIPRRRFLESVYLHEQSVARTDWEEWSRSETFQNALKLRLRALGCAPEFSASAEPGQVDAWVGLTQALVDARRIRRGSAARDVLRWCRENPTLVPDAFQTVRPDPENDENVILRGAVILQATGRRLHCSGDELPESLRAVLRDPPPRPWAPVWRALRVGGLLQPALIALSLLAGAVGTMLEALLFRGFFDLARHLPLGGQRLGAIAAFVAFLTGLLLIDWASEAGLLGLGRRIEARLRMQFLAKIPRLNDRYFQSRLISDMACRAHSIQMLRHFPELAGQFLRTAFAMICTVAGIGWLYPAALAPACAAAAASLLIPVVLQPALTERDLRFRELSGSLSRFYMDALMGLTVVKAHCAQQALRATQAGQLRHWAEAGLRQQALLMRAEGLQLVATLPLLIWLVFSQVSVATDPSGLLLLLYWALWIPAAGAHLAAIAWNYPSLRNSMLRFLEPVSSPEETVPPDIDDASQDGGVELEMEAVSVVASGHLLLDRIDLRVTPGEHVGIVGPSGAGKSSLVGLLLGWHKAVTGRVLVDRKPLGARELTRLRQATAWIDPQVHLFNDTLLENLGYGNGKDAGLRLGRAIEDASLPRVLKRLPDGLQTRLGEGGALVSGGEGQRVRMGRVMARPGVRLAILDEPARGLDHAQREAFLERARRHFGEATLFFITHDVSDTLDLNRILVIDRGRIVEDGNPRELYADAKSRYRSLCDEEAMVRQHIWANPLWRQLELSEGALRESAPTGNRTCTA